jgi:hypothetical protein
MPKEYIVTRAEQRRADEHGGRREAVRVGWNAEAGWVQIATVLKAEVEGASYETTAEVDQGQFVSLDREACNRIIRTLRTARDKAYGADA